MFWDTDVFVLPFLVATHPDTARALLVYRHRLLPAARSKAAALGYRGALYPRESADTGVEVTPPFVVDVSGQRIPILTGSQEQHIALRSVGRVAVQRDQWSTGPSGLSALAEEQSRGALRITPTLVTGAGGPLDWIARSRLMEAFNAPVYMNYGAAEAPYMAFDCPRGKLHLNVDWYILEPVDRGLEPVPPDQPSHTVLITNLANRVQPIIRYNLGDSITAISEPCSCGSKLPVIGVIGRTNDVLTFHTSGGQTIRLLPLALGTVIEETPGVHRFHAIQTEAATITVRLQVSSGTDQAQVWTALTQRLTAYLSAQGVPSIRFERDPVRPHADPVSGKYRQVWSEI